MRPNIKTHENNYGGTRRHHPEHDERILENFTDDNQDFLPHSAKYNDTEEVQTNTQNTAPPEENSDNKDYAMNKDSERGAQQKYTNTEGKTQRR